MKTANVERRFVLINTNHERIEDAWSDLDMVTTVGYRYHRPVRDEAMEKLVRGDVVFKAACKAMYTVAIPLRLADKVLKPCTKCWPES